MSFLVPVAVAVEAGPGGGAFSHLGKGHLATAPSHRPNSAPQREPGRHRGVIGGNGA